jgi:hypothetical protein
MRPTFAAVLLPLAFMVSAAEAQDCPPTPTVLSVSEYQQQLNELSNELKSAKVDPDYSKIASCLPEHWNVETGNTRFEIGTWAIRNDLYEVEKETGADDRSDKIDDLQLTLNSMRDQAGSYEDKSFSAQRAHLDQILAKPEYRHATGPGWQEQFKDWIYALLLKILGKSIEHVSGMLTLLRVLGWSLVLLAVAFVMRFIFRWLMLEGAASVSPGQIAISATHWTNWLGQARLAANDSDWRRAIHFSYWAAISYLESEGCWPADRARTPREYVGLMSEEGERRSLLVKLTRKFEYFWYAQHAATQSEYQETLDELEALGCR